MVPLAYGYTSPYHRRTLRRIFLCTLFRSGKWQVGRTKFESAQPVGRKAGVAGFFAARAAAVRKFEEHISEDHSHSGSAATALENGGGGAAATSAPLSSGTKRESVR